MAKETKKKDTKKKVAKTDTAKKTSAVEAKSTKTKLPQYFYAIGRRKTATATIRLFKGSEQSEINNKPATDVYALEHDYNVILEPFKATGLDADKFYFTARVKGSGHKGQLEAIRHGIARALVVMDETLKSDLKKAGLMTRDPRMVERKKPGLRKARRAEQFSKR